MERRFKAHPRPNSDVIEALEQALDAARNGYVRAVVIVTANPLFQVEDKTAGAAPGALMHALIGGLSVAAHKLLQDVLGGNG